LSDENRKEKQLIEELKKLRNSLSQLEVELQSTGNKFRIMVESSPFAVFAYREKFIFVNKITETFTGYTKDELYRMNFWKIIHPDFRDYVRDKGSKLLKGEKVPSSYEFKVVKKGGEECWVTFRGTYLADFEGEPAALGAVIDITENKEAEKTLRESEENFRTFLESAPVAIMIHQGEKWVFANSFAEKTTGYTKEELLSMNFWNFVHPDYRDLVIERGERRLRGENPENKYELKIIDKDGSEKWADLRAELIKYKGKNAILVSASDITQSKQVEKELELQKVYFESLFDNSPEAIALIDNNDRVVQINKSFQELFNYDIEEARGENINDLIVPDGRWEEATSFSQKVLNRKTVIEETVRQRKDGIPINVFLIGGPIIVNDKVVGIFAAYNDIGKRKGAEEKLRKSINQLEKTLSGAVTALAETVEKRDPYTAGHQRRVAQLTAAIGKEMGLSQERLETLKMASLLHDIGKIHIAAEILNKPLRLNELEMGLVKTHPQVGYDILKSVEFSGPVAEIVLQHHERMDGSGYPENLVGEDILLEARILGVADVVEAMGSRRPYRNARSIEIALDEIKKNRGTLYDPEVVDICIKLFEEEFHFTEQSILKE